MEKTTMWTMDNTEGFTQAQLDIINRVHEELTTLLWEEKAASDLINNVWNDSIQTVADLRKAVDLNLKRS
jgi:hypothetical protein